MRTYEVQVTLLIEGDSREQIIALLQDETVSEILERPLVEVGHIEIVREGDVYEA